MAAREDQHQIVIQTMEAMKRLVADQAARHARANPERSWQRVVEIEVDAAERRLLELSHELRTEGDSRGAALVVALIEDWLPVLARELQSQQ